MEKDTLSELEIEGRIKQYLASAELMEKNRFPAVAEDYINRAVQLEKRLFALKAAKAKAEGR